MSDTENKFEEDEGNFNEGEEGNLNSNAPEENENIIEEEEETKDDGKNGESNKNGGSEDDTIKNDNKEEEDEEERKKKIQQKEKEEEEEKEKKKIFFQNLYYNVNDLKPKLESKQIPESSSEIVYIFGFESEKLNNLYFLNETNIISAIGNYVYIVDINTLKQKYIPGIKNGGIGAIAVHPSLNFFAIAEKVENDPFIYIYEYPACKLYRILRNGSVKGYSAICFNNEGTRLASVGSDPDYTLTIWDWQQENVILRSKAFSQDIYRVEFLRENDQILTTSGMGHIKFWNISNTFTGLKLQGYLGKFGIVELSDIHTFLHLSDGKVLSSSETGYLLLWEGGLIKCVISRPGGKPCHNGKIFVLLSEEGEIYSSGEDGFVRIWDLENLDNADVSFDSNQGGNKKQVNAYQVQIPMFEIDPLDEINLGKNVRVNNIIKIIGSSNEFLIQDGSGSLFKLDIRTRSMFNVMKFHSKEVAGIVMNPIHHSMVSLGNDGSIKLYDYRSKKIIANGSYSSNGTVLRILPRTLDPKCNTYIAGYNDGVVKIIKYIQNDEDNQKKFIITHISKPHAYSISSLEISPDGRYLVTTAIDRTLFLYQIDLNPDYVNEMEITTSLKDRFDIIKSNDFVFSAKTVDLIPLGYIELHLNVINMSWSPDNHQNTEIINNFVSYDISDEKDEKDYKNAKFWEYKELYNTMSELTQDRLFIALEDGSLCEIITPKPNEIDNTLSFKLQPEQLSFKEWSFDIPKPRDIKFVINKKEKEQANNEGDEEENNNDKDIFDVLDKKDEEEEKKNNELIKHFESCLQGAKVMGIIYLPGGYFLVNFVLIDGRGQIRSCHYNSPNQSRIIFTYPKRIIYMNISNSRQYLLFGISDGSVIQFKFDYTDVIFSQENLYHEELDAQVLEYIMSEENTIFVDNFDQFANNVNNKNDNNKNDKKSPPEDSENVNNNNEKITSEQQEPPKQDQNQNNNNNEKNDLEKNDLHDLQFHNGYYFKANLHDNKNGNITGIALSFDDAYMASCGSDGAIFVFRNRFERLLTEEELDLDSSDKCPSVDDILDKNFYSLQEAKIKNDRDRELANAEIKKNETRSQIEELRNEFLTLLNENEKAEDSFKVDRELFKIDINLQKAHEMERKQKLEEIEKEFAWINEKENLGLQKLKSKFLDPLKTERIVISSFNTHQKISTFRTKSIELIMDMTKKNKSNGEYDDSNQSNINNPDASANNESNPNSSNPNNPTAEEEVKKVNANVEKKTGTNANKNDSNNENDSKTKEQPIDTKNKNELRKQERARRAILYKELLSQKPDPSTNDPRDEALIELAMATIGDFKLKTSDKYIVPENERINAEKKQKQIFMLARSIYELKEQFNKHVLNLKTRKESIIETIKEKKKIIDLIDIELKALNDKGEEPIIIPELDKEGYPERRYEVSDQDIEDFKVILEERKKKAMVADNDEDDGIGGFNATGPTKPKNDENDNAADNSQDTMKKPNSSNKKTAQEIELEKKAKIKEWKEEHKKKSQFLKENGINIINMLEEIDFDSVDIIELCKLVYGINKTKLEEEENENLKNYFKYLRREICDNIAEIKNKFDETFNILFSEQILLEGDIKFAKIRLILFYDEWVLLKEFQNHEAVLAQKLYNKKKEKLEIESKIKECQDKLLGKKQEIEGIIAIEKEIQKKFSELVNGNKYEEMLTKIFKKKIKRSKKKSSDDDDDNENSDDSSSDSDSDYDSDDDMDSESDADSSNEEEIEEICPEDLEQEIFDTVLNLRLEQSDQEYNISEIQKVIDALKKENDGYLKKEKIIDSALKGFETDIQEFQTLKQKRLNELDVVVPLKLSQIQYLNGQSIPSDLSAALVFQNEEVKRLKLRIKELHQEKADIRKQHHELRKMHNNLIINKKEKLARIVELEKKAYDVQMLKFGQIIDLEKLERMGVNKNAEELKEKLNKNENKYANELCEWNKKVQMNKEQLTAVTIENTKKMNTYLDLKKLYNKLEKNLTTAQTTLTTVYNDEDKKDKLEHEKLTNLVNDQRNEIEELKKEIEILMRKPNRSPLLKRVKKLNTVTTMMTLSGHPIRRVPLPPKENRLNSILNRNKMQKMEQDKLNEIMAEIDHPMTEVNTEPFEISTISDDKNRPLNTNQSIKINGNNEAAVTPNIEVQSAKTKDMNNSAPPTELDTDKNSLIDSSKPEDLPEGSIATTDLLNEQQQSILPELENNTEDIPIEANPITEDKLNDVPTENELDDVPTEQKPDDKPTEQKPDDEPTEQKPNDEPTEQKPNDEPTEQKPDDEPTEQKSNDVPTEQKPDDEPTDVPAKNEHESNDVPTENEPASTIEEVTEINTSTSNNENTDSNMNPQISEAEPQVKPEDSTAINKPTTNEISAEETPKTSETEVEKNEPTEIEAAQKSTEVNESNNETSLENNEKEQNEEQIINE